MTTAQKITRVKTLLGNEVEVDDATVTEYLSMASDKVLHTRYPFDIPEEYDLSRYDEIECELAARLFVRQGGLGELTHNENGINRTWYSSDDRELLAQITPMAKAVV